MLIALQLLIQTAPSALWAEPMHVSGLFVTLIGTLGDDKVCCIRVSSWFSENLNRSKASTTILTEHVHFFARMAVCDAAALVQLITAGANELRKPEADMWKDLLDQWWQRVCCKSMLPPALLKTISSLTTCPIHGIESLQRWV